METVNGCTVIPASESGDSIFFGKAETNGAYVAAIGAFPPGDPAVPYHSHPLTDEGFYIAEGEATFLLGDDKLTVTAGGFVFIPRNTPHTVWNEGASEMRGLLVISPADVEHEFVPAETTVDYPSR
jgi:quercetin dioxygenase-like cupin family protein